MSRLTCLGMLLLVALGLSAGCEKQVDPTPANLAGVWEAEYIDAQLRLKLNADGTYEFVSRGGGGMAWMKSNYAKLPEYGGEYRVDEGDPTRLTFRAPNMDGGMSMASSPILYSLTESTLTLEAGNQIPLPFKRLSQYDGL